MSAVRTLALAFCTTPGAGGHPCLACLTAAKRAMVNPGPLLDGMHTAGILLAEQEPVSVFKPALTGATATTTAQRTRYHTPWQVTR